MVRVWYMDDYPTNQGNEHQTNPPKYVDLDELNKRTGAQYMKLNLASIDTGGLLDEMKRKNGYTHEVEVSCSNECLLNSAGDLKIFYMEHLHTDEEIHICTEGSGYFDVCDNNDEWIPIEVTPGDMLILPGGIYHWFTLDHNNYIKARRLFIGEPIWTSYNRPVYEMDCRKSYLEKLEKGSFVPI